MTKSTMYSGRHNVIRLEDVGNTSRSISKREIISRKKRTSPKKQTNKKTEDDGASGKEPICQFRRL